MCGLVASARLPGADYDTFVASAVAGVDDVRGVGRSQEVIGPDRPVYLDARKANGFGERAIN